jgi:hypothetical protein
MNGKVITDATSLENSETLSALLDAPFLTTGQRVEALYLATLARQPSSKELERSVRFVDEATKGIADAEARRAAYNDAVADVFWALLNTSEFSLNH